MKKQFAVLMATITLSLLPTLSHAQCVATGQISRTFVVPTPGLTNIGVRSSDPGSTFFNFTTSNLAIITAAVTAEASHKTVTMTGNAAACGPVVGGLSAGGTVVNITQ